MVPLQSKRDFTDLTKDPEVGRGFWIMWVGLKYIHKCPCRGAVGGGLLYSEERTMQRQSRVGMGDATMLILDRGRRHEPM